MLQFHDADSAPSTPTHLRPSLPYGVKSETGRRSSMEDAHSVCPNICDIWLPGQSDALAERLPLRVASDTGACSTQTSPNKHVFDLSDTNGCKDNAWQELHYFGVFDGHAGSEISEHCASRLQHHLRQALHTSFGSPGATCFIEIKGLKITACLEKDGGSSISLSSVSSGPGTPMAREELLGQSPAFSEMATLDEKLAGLSLRAGGDSTMRGHFGDLATADSASLHSSMDSAILNAFLTADHEISTTCSGASLMGSTAVVALVGRTHIWAANCGDSRAVLCRSGQAIQLTEDHKPSRSDEAARITRAGGQITNNHGQRVQGVLAMTRALGDHALRPYVISDPEVTYVARRSDDELLLMASDGLWDVLGNQEAVTLALRCLQSAQAKGATRSSAARIAAKVLARAALDKGSRDNITVLVVDLAQHTGSDS